MWSGCGGGGGVMWFDEKELEEMERKLSEFELMVKVVSVELSEVSELVSKEGGD
jgi:hypothetical protein